MNNQTFKFQLYRKKPTTVEMCPWEKGFPMQGVSVSAADLAKGSPKVGDMIARNSDNPDDRWLVAREYFEEHYETDPVQ